MQIMTTFLDKLKKGMDGEESFDKPKEIDKELENDDIKPTKEQKSANSEPARTTGVQSGGQRTANKKKKVKPIKKIKIEKIENVKNEEPRKDKKWFESEGELTVDVYQTDEEIVIQSAIAGIEAEDLDIFIENDLVSIKGNRAKPFSNEKKSYFHQECYWGPFSREIILPEEVDPSRINAEMKQGVLTIRIPKVEREKKRKVKIAE